MSEHSLSKSHEHIHTSCAGYLPWPTRDGSRREDVTRSRSASCDNVAHGTGRPVGQPTVGSVADAGALADWADAQGALAEGADADGGALAEGAEPQP